MSNYSNNHHHYYSQASKNQQQQPPPPRGGNTNQGQGYSNYNPQQGPTSQQQQRPPLEARGRGQPPPQHYQQQQQPHPSRQQHQQNPPPSRQQPHGQNSQPMRQPQQQQQQYPPPLRQPQQQIQYPPPLRQPQQPTLPNLIRDFASAEELLTTLQEFNKSCDIFNNFEMPYSGDNPQDQIDIGSLQNAMKYMEGSGGGGNSQRQGGNSSSSSSSDGRQAQQPSQGRHQLQNNCYSEEQAEYVLPELRAPQNMPQDVMSTLLKYPGTGQIFNSFANRGGQQDNDQNQQYSQAPPYQQHPPPHVNSQNLMGSSESDGSSWGNLQEPPPRENEFTSAPLGTSGWGPPPSGRGPPPGAQGIGMNTSNTSNPPHPDIIPSSSPQMNNPQGINSPRSTSSEVQNSGGWQDDSPQNASCLEKPTSHWSPSPFAAEFVPKPQHTFGADDMARGIANLNFPEQTNFYEGNQNYYQGGGDADDAISDASEEFILQTVTDSINRICGSPAVFSRSVKEMTDVLRQHLVNMDTLIIVVTLIIEQSIAIPNFRYSGARLCQAFHQSGVKVGDLTFKKALLKGCQEEFTKCISTVNPNAETDKRAQGLLMFLGELFVNFQLVVDNTQKPISVFANAAVELMNFLVQAERQKNYENIRTVVQVLKLIGWDFENSENEDVRSQMENLMKELTYIMAMSTDSKSRSMIENVIELKKRGWERVDSNNAQIETENTSFKPGPVYYELPDSDDDDIDERYLVLDDEPEEVCRFYEEFLLSTEAKKGK